MKLRKLLAAVTFAAASVFATAPAQAVPTTALYLTMDGSGSIDAGEFTTQVNAYVGALNAFFADFPSFYGKVAIGGGIFGANFAEFFPVTEISNSTVLGSLTTAISGLNPGRAGINTGSTAIGDAITLSKNALVAYETSLGVDLRLLIDVTTDGANNLGSNPATVAAALVPSPLNAVNCLGIGAGASCSWVGSAGTNFGIVANFEQMEAALTRKLQAEITGVPEPGTLALLGLGLAGLAAVRRRQTSK